MVEVMMSWVEGGGRSVAAMPSDEFVFCEKSAPLEGCGQKEGGVAALTLLIACVWIKAKISCGFSTPLRSRKKYLKGTDAQDGFGF